MPNSRFEGSDDVNNLGLRKRNERDPYVPTDEIEDTSYWGMSPDEVIMLRETMDEEVLNRILKGEYLAKPDEGEEGSVDHIVKRNNILRMCMEKLQEQMDNETVGNFIHQVNSEKIAKIQKMLNPHGETEDEPLQELAA